MLFVKAFATGASAAESARQAGYSEGYARRSAYDLLRRPSIAAEIEKIREQIRQESKIDAAAMLKKLETALEQATTAKQFSAVARILEIQAKLCGLLIERQHLMHETVSITDALEAARSRVLRVVGEGRGDDAAINLPLLGPSPGVSSPAEPQDVFGD
jgi:phage terminase small subunit